MSQNRAIPIKIQPPERQEGNTDGKMSILYKKKKKKW